jgi:hypothetical protein
VGFYLRKGFSFGPLRLNLSGSGLGASVGVKGARIGIGPRGRYIHVGRGGLYYRKALGGAAPARLAVMGAGAYSQSGREMQQSSGLGHAPGPAPLASATSAPPLDMSQLADSSSADLLAELRRSRRALAWFAPALVAAALIVAALILRLHDWRIAAVAAVALIMLLMLIARADARRCVTELHYHLDPSIGQAYEALLAAFAKLGGCAGRWHAGPAGKVVDPRALAGATLALDPEAIAATRELPDRVRSNVAPPALRAGARTLYLFPDRILVFQGRELGAVSWSEAHITAGSARMIEQRTPPADARIVDHKWLHPNRDGGPDRRFSVNPQLPVVEYGELRIAAPGGLDERFLFSQVEPAAAFAAAVVRLVETHPEADRPAFGVITETASPS